MQKEIQKAIESRRDVLGLEPLDEASIREEVREIYGLLCMVNEMARLMLLNQFKLTSISMAELRRRCLTNDP